METWYFLVIIESRDFKSFSWYSRRFAYIKITHKHFYIARAVLDARELFMTIIYILRGRAKPFEEYLHCLFIETGSESGSFWRCSFSACRWKIHCYDEEVFSKNWKHKNKHGKKKLEDEERGHCLALSSEFLLRAEEQTISMAGRCIMLPHKFSEERNITLRYNISPNARAHFTF